MIVKIDMKTEYFSWHGSPIQNTLYCKISL